MTRPEAALWVSEHGWILKGPRNRCLDNGNLELCPNDFGSLESLLEQSETDEGRHVLPLHYCRRHALPAFKVDRKSVV